MNRRFLLLLLMIIMISSCAKDNDDMLPNSGLSDYELNVIAYFKEIALGFEFGNASRVTRKWNSELRIFIGGDPSPEILDELDIIMKGINELVTDGFQMNIVTDSLQSNYYIFFGAGAKYAALFPNQSNFVDVNWGLFQINFNGQNQLTSGHMYVDIDRANPALQRHLLREELTQSLGLVRDSPRFRESIFQSSASTVSKYTLIDQDLIRLLYHPDMIAGLDDFQVEIVLREILLSE